MDIRNKEKIIRKVCARYKFSFKFMDWVKKYIKIPSQEKAYEILKETDISEIKDSYQTVFNKFKSKHEEKQAFDFKKITNKLMILAALAVVLGGTLPQAKSGELPPKALDAVEKIKSSGQIVVTLDEDDIEDVFDDYNKRSRFDDAQGTTLVQLLIGFANAENKKVNLDGLTELEKGVVVNPEIAKNFGQGAYYGFSYMMITIDGKKISTGNQLRKALDDGFDKLTITKKNKRVY